MGGRTDLFRFPDSLTHHLGVNLLAWQFLFVIGLFVATKQDFKQLTLLLRPHLRLAVAAACTVVVGAFLYKLLAARSGFDIAWLRLEPSTLASMKDNLSPMRLVHFFSVAFLVAVYFRRDRAFLKWPLSMPLIKTGMHSLQVFSLAVVLGNLFNLIVLTGAPPLGDRLIMDGIAFLLMALTGIAVTPVSETLVGLRKRLVTPKRSLDKGDKHNRNDGAILNQDNVGGVVSVRTPSLGDFHVPASEAIHSSDSRSEVPGALVAVVFGMGLMMTVAWWVVLVEFSMTLVRYFVTS